MITAFVGDYKLILILSYPNKQQYNKHAKIYDRQS